MQARPQPRGLHGRQVAPNGRKASVLTVFPSQVAGAASAPDSIVKFFARLRGLRPGAACGVSGFLFPHIDSPKGTVAPHADFRGVEETLDLRNVRGKQSVTETVPESY